MAVSGTVSTTVFQTRKVIDHAFRRCRMQPQQISSELIDTALDNLYLLLSSLGSQGVPLWCIEKDILPLYLGQATATPPKGTMDILNANYRWLSRQNGPVQYSAPGGIPQYAFDGDLTTSCAQTGPNGNIEIAYIGADPITARLAYEETVGDGRLHGWLSRIAGEASSWQGTLGFLEEVAGAVVWTVLRP